MSCVQSNKTHKVLAVTSVIAYFIYMARVTVEDCVTRVANRFKLVIYAAKRANELRSGVAPEVEVDNDKETVLALREIADGALKAEDLKERSIKSMQKLSHFTEDDEDGEVATKRAKASPAESAPAESKED